MTDVNEPDQAPRHLRLRPGAAIYEISTDELQISFPNYTVTFTSPMVTAGVLAIVAATGSGAERSEVVAGAADATGIEPAVIEYLVDSLLGSNCLALGRLETATSATARVPRLRLRFARRHRRAGSRPRAWCCSNPPTIRATSRLRFARSTSRIDIVEATPGTATAPVIGVLREALKSATVFGCWNVPFRSPFARQVNELVAAGTVPGLFGSCDGVVGRVGPFVIPRNTACLKCVNQRLLAHAGGPELHAYQQYRLRNEEVVPPVWPTHPLLVRAVAGLFAVGACSRSPWDGRR